MKILPGDHNVLGKRTGVVFKYCSIWFFGITHFKEMLDILNTSNPSSLIDDISINSFKSKFVQLWDFFNIDNDLQGKYNAILDVSTKIIDDFHLLNKRTIFFSLD